MIQAHPFSCYNGEITDTIRTSILSLVQFRVQKWVQLGDTIRTCGYNGDITDTIRTCGYDWEKTDTIRRKVWTLIHFKMS